jgi:transposase
MIRGGSFAMAVAVTRLDLSARELRREAARSKDADAARRMLAIALVVEGKTRAEAAETCGMDRQSLRDWVHRYNAEGVGGLSNRKSPGVRPRLTPAQTAELAALVEAGPDVAADGVVRWRRVDLRGVIEARFGVAMHERTVGKILHRLGFGQLSVRPAHPQGDIQARAAFKKTSPLW